MAKERKQESVRQSVLVDCPIEDAFQLFTERFSDWWPLAAYSMTGEDAESCEIEPWTGGRVFERTKSGDELEWGSVVDWDPPEHIRLNWRRDDAGEGCMTVDVEFSVEADGTRVTVIHSGWEAAKAPACMACFAAFVSEQALIAV